MTKRILITAKNSFIGNSYAEWVKNNIDYSVSFISCRTDEWKTLSFSNYDVILHVAGIAHVNAKNELASLYYKVNFDLTVELAKKAKLDGVRQFIFMSSMIVFGESNKKNKNLVITKSTQPKPDGFYGDSKLKAERALISLKDERFKVVIIRPPMVYGKDSKGNFQKLLMLANITPIFPKIDNKRSMLYIDNLCEFIKLMIDNNDEGVFHPQNSEYVNTSELIRMICELHGKKVLMTSVFNPLVRTLGRKFDLINKLFGSFYYDMELSKYKIDYRVETLDDSLRLLRKNR